MILPTEGLGPPAPPVWARGEKTFNALRAHTHRSQLIKIQTRPNSAKCSVELWFQKQMITQIECINHTHHIQIHDEMGMSIMSCYVNSKQTKVLLFILYMFHQDNHTILHAPFSHHVSYGALHAN